MSRFDQEPGKPYGHCLDCGIEFADAPSMSAHLHDTYEAGKNKSHRGRTTNSTRAERIENELERLAEDALSDFVENAWRLVDRDGVTEDEITAAVRSVVADFDDAWRGRS